MLSLSHGISLECTLECTLEYYEILNSRFALEHRYTADGRFIDSESRASRLLENCDIHHIIDLHERLGKTARERLTVRGFVKY